MKSFKEYVQAGIERIRMQLAGSRGVLLLSTLGLITGLLAAGIIILFRLIVEHTQAGFLPLSNPENYEALEWTTRLLLTTGGGLLLGILFYISARPPLRVGVLHVLERLSYHEGLLPFKNMFFQFIGAAIAIITGQSVGREAPSVHLGAAGGSLLGQKMRLPNNSIRILVACGSAGAIAASFNTPLAGVIFSMEVIMMEYTISGFIPVILAAVSATATNRLVMESHPAFIVPVLELNSLWELVIVVIMGVAIGAIAAIFINSLMWVSRKGKQLTLPVRMTVAGFIVGLCAIICPEVMGIGYDTVNQALLGSIGIQLLFLILVFKLLATVVSIGLSIPAGLIGPILFIGAIFGSLTGLLLQLMPGFNPSPPVLYAMLGMGAMMGATLQAPLAALIALLELTGNQYIIFPGMLAIVSASLSAQELFGTQSVFISQMREMGLDYRNDPVAQSLRRLGVAAVMNQNFVIVQPQISSSQVQKILATEPQWLVISRKEGNQLMPATDLVRFMETHEGDQVDLMEVPSKRKQLASVLQQSTLQQAIKILDDTDAEALYVIRPVGVSADRIYGIVTRQDIEEKYRLHQHY